VEPRFISVEERAETGSQAGRRIRRSGNVPAVVYAEGRPARNIVVNAHEYQLAVRGCRPTQIFKFKSKTSDLDGVMTLIKAVQIEPVKGQVQHVDFISISAGHRLAVTVPVELIGESLAVKENRAFLNQTVYEIEVECLPDSIPSGLKLDITPLKEGGTLHASDVQLPEGVKLRSLPALTLVSAISKKAMEAQEAALEAQQAASAPAAAAGSAEGSAAGAASGGKEEKKGK
jgi:large subunit ribosomal protein L25